jgi:hypothetical protein
VIESFTFKYPNNGKGLKIATAFSRYDLIKSKLNFFHLLSDFNLFKI